MVVLEGILKPLLRLVWVCVQELGNKAYGLCTLVRSLPVLKASGDVATRVMNRVTLPFYTYRYF